MKHPILAALAASALLLASCISSTGGSPIKVLGEVEGNAVAGYDLNTAVVIYSGKGNMHALEAESSFPLYLPLEWDGDGAIVRVHKRVDGGEKVDASFDFGVDGRTITMPAELAVYVSHVLPGRLSTAWYEVVFEAPPAGPPAPTP